MNNRIYTYSLIRAYYDAGKDYIDSFWPFIVCAIPNNDEMSLDSLQEKLLNEYSLLVPIHTLNVILTRAKKAGYVIQEHNTVFLSEKGKTYQQSLEVPRAVERRINNFLSKCKQYILRKYQYEIEINELQTRIDSLLVTNANIVEKYFSHDIDEVEEEFNGMNDVDQAILKFFIYVEKEEPESYETLRDMIIGSIISVVLSSADMTKITKKINKTSIYLDSNVIISILGLDIDEFCKPAQEMFVILSKDPAIELKVFDFTLNETVSVLKNYIFHMHDFFPDIKVRSLYSNLRTLGWTRTDLREYIVDIEKHLRDKKIHIEPTKVNLEHFSLEDPAYRIKMSEYKPGQGPLAQSHDLAVIKKVKDQRPSQIHRFENSKAIFITSDKRLAEYNFNVWGHSSYGSIAEVFPDSVITNIFWLKNPKNIENLSIETLISMQSMSGESVERYVWKLFISNVKDLRDNGNIDDKDVALLLYDSRIQDDLVEAKSRDITNDWIKSKIDRAKKDFDKEEKEKIEAIELSMNEEMQEITDKIFHSIQKSKSKIREKAVFISRTIINSLSFLLFILIIWLSINIFPTYLSNWELIEPIIGYLQFLFLVAGFLFGLKFNLSEFRINVINWIFEKANQILIELSDIEEIAKAIS